MEDFTVMTIPKMKAFMVSDNQQMIVISRALSVFILNERDHTDFPELEAIKEAKNIRAHLDRIIRDRASSAGTES